MKLQILIADSGGRTEQNLDLLRSVIADTEFEIGKYTSDLQEAVTLLLARRCDLLICINRSPGYIAAKLLRLTRSITEQIPAIVISESEDSQRMRECFLLGAIDFLSEPVPHEDLMHALERGGSLVHARLINSEYQSAMEQSLSELPHTEQNAQVIAKLEEFLRRTADQTATVELAADHFGFNRDYFGRYFKGKFGITFGDFYKSFQMHYAMRLLESGQFKVLDVSRQLGFSSPDYFTRVFKRRTGKVPSDVRKL